MPSRALTRVLAGLVVVLLVAGVALSVLLAARLDDRRTLERAGQDALTAGRQLIVNLDSLSAATVDADMARVLSGATGTFKDQFARSQEVLKERIVELKTISSATIVSAGVVSHDTASATLLIAAERSLKDSTTPRGTVIHDRWKVYLEKHKGKWLVATLEPVG
jgi:Mce-associated membrane protein